MTLMPMKRRGLFGAQPWDMQNPLPAPQSGMGGGIATPAQPEEQNWLNGGKMTGRDALGLALAGIGDAFGRRGSNNLGTLMGQNAMARQQERAMQQREQMRQQARMEGRQDKQWEWDNAPQKPETPTTFQRDYQYIMQTQGEEAAAKYMENKINPPVWRQGADGQFYRVDTTGTQPTVLGATLPQGWTIEGGSGGNAAGGF